jgi:hypothetical protein
VITRDRSEQQEQNKQDDKQKKRRHKSDWRKLVEELERRGGYVDRAVINDPRRDRRERRRPHS